MESVHNTISINRKKIKATSNCNRLYNEYTRDEATADHYDDGHRAIDTARTADNILLADETGDVKLDAYRKRVIKGVNEARKRREEVTADDAPKSKKTAEEREKWAKLSNSNRQRGLRKDTVDLIGNVIQLGNGALETLPEDQQILAYKAAFEVMKQHPEDYGKVLVASIHRDESSMHLQVMTSAIDEHEMKSRAKEMFGNKSKMSDDQTKFVDRVQDNLKSKGLDIDINRGLKRVDNPEYTNFKEEMEASGYEVTRYHDNELLEAKNARDEAQNETEAMTNDALNFVFDIFDSSQELANTDFKYNREAMADGFDEDESDDHYLRYTGDYPNDSVGYSEQHEQATSDVHEFNDVVFDDDSTLKNVLDWYQGKLASYKQKAKDMYDKAIDIKRNVLNGLGAGKTLPRPSTRKDATEDEIVDGYASGDIGLRVNGVGADDDLLIDYALTHASIDQLKRHNAATLKQQATQKAHNQADDDLEL